MTETIPIGNNSLDINCRIICDITQSIERNESSIVVTGIEFKSGSGSYTTHFTGTIKVNGTTVISGTNTNGVPVNLQTSWLPVNKSLINKNAITVRHESDGTKSITISANLDFWNTSLSYAKSKTYALPKIERSSSIGIGNVVLGSQTTISIIRETQDFCDTVAWSCGSMSGTIETQTTKESITWTPPLNIATQNTSDVYVDILLTITTYRDSDKTLIGSNTITVTAAIPDSVVPTISSITLSDTNGFSTSIGSYVQNRSILRVETKAYGTQGASISSINVVCAGTTLVGSDVSFNPLNVYGTVSVIVTVFDSRGRSVTETKAIPVLQYELPSINVISIARCAKDDSGNYVTSPDGGYVRIRFNASVYSVKVGTTEKNTASYRIQIKQRTSSVWTNAQNLNGVSYSTLIVTGGEFIISADKQITYDCRIVATDKFGDSPSAIYTIGIAFALMDFDKGNESIGFGQRATHTKTVDFGLNVNMNEHKISGLPESDITDLNCVVSMGFLKKLFEKNQLTWSI